ncbi:MAG TPA: response regulator, partial [Rhodospirillales bacterium]|nr:response regulator [Rhodospirillales bacterium]
NSKAISRHPKTAAIFKIKTERQLKILIAEDNPINQRLIKATIEAFGHQAEVVENGLLAVAAVIGGDFDLLFMDVRMPEMNGSDATRTLRKLPGAKSAIPIIAVTSDATNEHRKEYMEAGMNDCVGKPIDRAEMLEAINKVMGEEIHVRTEVEGSGQK